MTRKKMVNYHISTNKKTGRWDIQMEGCTHPSISTKNKKDAEHLAKQFVLILGEGKVIIHEP